MFPDIDFPSGIDSRAEEFYRFIVNSAAREYHRQLGWELSEPPIKAKLSTAEIIGNDFRVAGIATEKGFAVQVSPHIPSRLDLLGGPRQLSFYANAIFHEYAHTIIMRHFQNIGDFDWYRKGWNLVHIAAYHDQSYIKSQKYGYSPRWMLKYGYPVSVAVFDVARLVQEQPKPPRVDGIRFV